MGIFWPMHWIWNTGVQKEAPTLARSFGCNWRSKAQSERRDEANRTYIIKVSMCIRHGQICRKAYQ
jgi:hypothetical protein